MNPFDDFGDVVVYAIFVLLPFLTGAALVWLARYSRRTGRARHWAVVLWANLLGFALLVSLLLAGLETYCRFWSDTTDSWGLSRITLRWFHRHWGLNHSGFRDSLSDFSARIAPGKRRFTFLGDSFTAGHGVPNVEDRFANRLRNQGQDEVHVCANIGFETGDEIKVLQALIAQQYQLDEVILIYNLNDIGDLSPNWKVISARINSYRPGFILQHSFLLDTLYYWWKGRSDPDIANYGQSLRKEYDGPVWDEQCRRLQTLRSLVETNGGHLRVVTFPFLQRLGPTYEFRAVHDKLDRWWKGQGVPHLDLLDLYEAHRQESLTVNSHDAHPNARAHALAAEAIKAFLDKGTPPAPQ